MLETNLLVILQGLIINKLGHKRHTFYRQIRICYSGIDVEINLEMSHIKLIFHAIVANDKK